MRNQGVMERITDAERVKHGQEGQKSSGKKDFRPDIRARLLDNLGSLRHPGVSEASNDSKRLLLLHVA
jgi:hypothetical protein